MQLYAQKIFRFAYVENLFYCISAVVDDLLPADKFVQMRCRTNFTHISCHFHTLYQAVTGAYAVVFSKQSIIAKGFCQVDEVHGIFVKNVSGKKIVVAAHFKVA